MKIYFFRPKPRYGLAARFKEEPANQKWYLAIESRRWMWPEGRQRKQWTYTGWLMEQNGSDPLKFIQRMFDIPEDLLCPIEKIQFVPGFAPE